MSYQQPYFLGVPVKKFHGLITTPVPGSVQMPCAGCRANVWIGPKQQIAKRNTGGTLLCVECIAKEGYTLENTNQIPLSDGGHDFKIGPK